MIRRVWAGAATVALVLGIGACDSTITSGALRDATVRVLLAGAPSQELAAAEIDVATVSIVAEDGAELPLALDATTDWVDLTELAGGLTMEVADSAVDPGGYTRLRLVIEAVRVELASAWTFADGTRIRELTVPTEVADGIDLNLEVGGGEDDVIDGIEIERGDNVLVAALDVAQSFRLVEDPDAAGVVTEVLFSPAVRVVDQEVAGSISGTVFGILVGGLRVTAFPLDQAPIQTYQTRTAITVTPSNGIYTLHFMAPGEYAVDVAADSGFTTQPTIAEVTVGPGQAVTGVDFQIVSEF